MANLKTGEKKTKAQSMGLHTEVLTGKPNKSFLTQMKLKTSITLEHTMLILIKEQRLMSKIWSAEKQIKKLMI